MQKTEKIHKILARCGLGSRRLMEQWLSAGRVRINSHLATVASRASKQDQIIVDGKLLSAPSARTQLLAYNKPRGKWVTRAGGVETVFDDLPLRRYGRWINIGRLDVNSEGLLLFTNDGDFAHRLAHPRGGMEREYRARVSGLLNPHVVRSLCREGVTLCDGLTIRPVLLRLEKAGVNSWYRIILREGRNRIVKRLFAHFDLQVSRLLRVRFGCYHLPADFACWWLSLA